MRDAVAADAIVKDIWIAASPETVFEFFTRADKITRWLAMEATVDPRPGGLIRQTHVPDAGDPNHRGEYHMRGEFLEVSPPSRVVFTWGFENPDVELPPGSTTVEVTLEPEGAGTRLTLRHHGLTGRARADTEGGWPEVLRRLAAAVTASTPEAKAEMLIRRPVGDVFRAFADPEVTSQFWFTHGSARLEPGKTVTWSWEMYDMSIDVHVKAVEPERRILIEWPGYGEPTLVEWLFAARPDGTTFVTITNRGFSGTNAVRDAISSTEGFSFVLAGCKALLEHGVRLNLVPDRHPDGLPG
jgi:uncharacterized protein YndB with AHSA1/START domain